MFVKVSDELVGEGFEGAKADGGFVGLGGIERVGEGPPGIDETGPGGRRDWVGGLGRGGLGSGGIGLVDFAEGRGGFPAGCCI